MPTRFPSVSGTRIIAPDGKPMLWRGIGLGMWLLPEGYMFGFGPSAGSPRQIEELVRQLVGEEAALSFWQEYRDAFITRDDLALIQRCGFDHVRLPINWRQLVPEELPRRLAGPGWELIERCVAWCRELGLGVVLDLHGAPGGQTGDNIDDSPGYPFLFEDEASQELCCRIWSELARRYADEPTVWAYELLNEPIAHHEGIWSPEMGARLEPLYRRLTAAIRIHDREHIIVLGGARWNTEFSVFGKPFDPLLVYAFHRYFMPIAPDLMEPYATFARTHDVPVWLGETGENTMEWIAEIRRQSEAADIGWAFWTYKRISNDGRCVTSIVPPAEWAAVQEFAKAARATFADIRKHRPPHATCRAALRGFLDAIRVARCRLNPGYMAALGL